MRGGPGVQYAVVGTLEMDDYVIVTGRAATVEWWQVELPAGAFGWVGNSVVNIYGDAIGIDILNLAGNPTQQDTTWLPTVLDCIVDDTLNTTANAVQTDEDVLLSDELVEAEPANLVEVPKQIAPQREAMSTPDDEAELIANEPEEAVSAETEPQQEAAPIIAWRAINLSQSGATRDPSIFPDLNGDPLVIWQDELSGIVAATQQGIRWQQQVLDAPFDQIHIDHELERHSFAPHFIQPQFLMRESQTDVIWVNADALLLHASLSTDDNSAEWSEAAVIATNVKGFTAQLERTTVHLSFISGSDETLPTAGIYYQRLRRDVWSEPALVDDSRYLRQPLAEPLDLQFMIDDGRLLVAWDDIARERVLFARSADSGQNWQIKSIDQRLEEDIQLSVSPHNVRFTKFNDSLLLLWQAGHKGAICQQHMQLSDDLGRTWSESTILTQIGCLENPQLLDAGNHLILSGTSAGETQMAAWDGVGWSDLQAQTALSTMTNLETFRPLELACVDSLVSQNVLWVVACDNFSHDVWLFSRPLSDIANWFPSPLAWQATSQPLLLPEVQQLQTVVDAQGVAHAFWQDDDVSISHVRFENNRWSTPARVIETYVGEGVYEPTLATNGDQLYAIWQDERRDGLQFSRVETDFAGDSAEWLEPTTIATDGLIATDAQLTVASDGTLLAVYAVPINAQRGVYLIRSADNGKSWDAPEKIFDAELNDWSMVTDPQLLVAPDGVLYVQWTRQTTTGISGLYHAQSSDSGASWSTVVQITDQAAHNSTLLRTADGTLHHIWQLAEGNKQALQHTYSTDSGLTWQAAVTPSSFEQFAGAIATRSDNRGLLHLVVAANDAVSAWLWDGAQWVADRGFDIANPKAKQVVSVVLDETSIDTLQLVLVIATNDGFQFKTARRILEPVSIVSEPVSSSFSQSGVIDDIGLVEEDDLIIEDQEADEEQNNILLPPEELDPNIFHSPSRLGSIRIFNFDPALILGIGIAVASILSAIAVVRFSRKKLS